MCTMDGAEHATRLVETQGCNTHYDVLSDEEEVAVINGKTMI